MLPKYHNDLIPKYMRTRMIDDMRIRALRRKSVCRICKIPFSKALYFVYNTCSKCIEKTSHHSTDVIEDTICPTCGGYCAKNGEFYYCHEEHCKQLPFKNKVRWHRTIDLKTGKSKKVKIYEGRHF